MKVGTILIIVITIVAGCTVGTMLQQYNTQSSSIVQLYVAD